jgi:ClpP class serine protease
MMRIWNRITGDPWAITETALHTILEVAARENEAPEAVAAKLGRQLQNSYNATERDGVAIIPVTGPLFRYANIFTAISGASSYELIARDFMSALENPQISSIILDIDSPGGEVNGVSELASMIFEARGTKPIIAYASGDAASGAYWISSAADEIVVSETSALGSIGVVGIYRGKSAKESTETVEIVSSQSPHKRLDPTSDDGRAKLQTRIDAMADVFVSTIARNRSVTADHVLEHYGGGDVMIGAHAVNAGLADRIGSLERLITELSSPKTQSPPQEGFFSSTQPKKEKTPMNLEQLKTDHPDLVASLHAEGSAKEKQRLKDILSCEAAEGRQKLAQEIALNTEINAMDAQHLMKSAPKDEPEKSQSSSFERVMSSIPNPEIAPDGDDHIATADTVADRIASTR